MVTLFGIHFLADFLLQSREMGQKKSKELIWLIRHLCIITACFLIPSMMMFGFRNGYLFCILNSLIHGLIDGTIWKLYAYSVYKRRHKLRTLFVTRDEKTFMYWNDHWFYTTIGLDQMLHYVTIIVLFNYFN